MPMDHVPETNDASIPKLPPRNENGQFQKGVSGRIYGPDHVIRGPDGKFVSNKPRISYGEETQREVQELFKEASPILFKQLMKVIMDPKTPPSARVNAIKEALNRAHGKPAVTVQTASEAVYDGLDVSKLSDDAKREIITITLKEANREDD